MSVIESKAGMQSLNALLQPLAGMINRRIREKTPARALCEHLDGRTMALRVKDSSLTAYLRVEEDALLLTSEYSGEPDVVLTGTIVALARLAGSSGEAVIREGGIDLNGDALVAQQFQKLLQLGRPDAEDELARLLGQGAAHGVGTMARNFHAWSRDARATMQQNVAEYLQEETRAVPGRHEIEAFQSDIELLRDEVARLEARVKRIHTSQNTSVTRR